MARICMVCEGSYPYIVGGVSSWVHDLIKINPQHEFILLCVLPNSEFAEVRYELPENIIQVKNIILNEHEDICSFKVFKSNLFRNKEVEGALEKLMNFKKIDPLESIELFEEVCRENSLNSSEMVSGRLFWNAMKSYYERNHETINYNLFYWTYRNIFLNLFELLDEELPEADIYHPVATGYAGFISAIASQRGLGRVVLTEHGIYPREREEEILNSKWIDKDFKGVWVEFFYYLSKVTYAYADEIISLFDYNKNLQIEYGALAERCRVIPNGVDINRFFSLEREERGGFNIGAVLRVVPIKDVKMMLKAFKVAKNKMKDARLYLIGPTDENEEYYRECRELVTDFDLEDVVEFTGKTQVDDYYKFLDLMILSSVSEGQPLTILEGLASGIPFVATDVGNCREILKEKREIGEAGVVVPPTSYTFLAEGIIKLYQNRERMKILGENGRKIVKTYYPREKFIQAYREVYERLGGD